MAEALKKPGAEAADDQKADPGKLPTKTVVTKLAGTVQALQKKITSLTGEKGAAIKAASDNDQRSQEGV